MPYVSDAVPESALDYDEILRRGGANCGDENFALFKCPRCGRLYWIDYEVDTVYLDANALDRREAVNIGVSRFRCDACGEELPSECAWIGEEAPASMQVTWDALASSFCRSGSRLTSSSRSSRDLEMSS